MYLDTHSRREFLDRIKPFFVFQIGMDIRIIEISCGVESFFLQPEIRIECAWRAADMEKYVHCFKLSDRQTKPESFSPNPCLSCIFCPRLSTTIVPDLMRAFSCRN